MQLHERLMDLLDHEVSVTAQADDGAKGIPVGTVKEVGPDYLIIGTEGRDIRLAMVVAIVHATDCPKCMAPD
jgi:ferredoxin-fold anticodon binding domain-containing protein